MACANKRMYVGGNVFEYKSSVSIECSFGTARVVMSSNNVLGIWRASGNTKNGHDEIFGRLSGKMMIANSVDAKQERSRYPKPTRNQML